MRNYKIAAIPADGIGPEVIEAGLKVLNALGQRDGALNFEITNFDWGSKYYRQHGQMMPNNGLELLKPMTPYFLARLVRQIFLIIQPRGDLGCQFAKVLISMRMSVQQEFCLEFRHRWLVRDQVI